MTPITQVQLHGFKGIQRTYNLAGPTLLNGPNGSGKSACLEGLMYAILGKVPAGKSPELVAGYFPPGGGGVLVKDSEGRYLSREIGVSKGGKVSELVESSEDQMTGPQWNCTPIALDIREFLGLSANARREAVLKLCGGGAKPVNLCDTIANQYALEIRSSDPKAEEVLRTAWGRRGGLRDSLESYLLVPGKSLSELLLACGGAAHEMILACRRAAKTESAAIETLEAQARGAQAAALDIDVARAGEEKARGAVEQFRRRSERLDEARKGLRSAEEAKAAAERQVIDFSAALERHPDPGARPEPPGTDTDGALVKLQKAAEETREAVITAREAVAAWKKNYELAEEARDRAMTFEGKIAAELLSPIGRLTTLVESLRDEEYGRLREIRGIVAEVAHDWKDRITYLEVEHEKAIAAQIDHKTLYLGAQNETPSPECLAAYETRAKEALAALQRAASEAAMARQTYEDRLRSWTAASNVRRASEEALKAAQARSAEANSRSVDAQKRLAAIESVNTEAGIDLDALEVAFFKTKAVREKAEEAAGVLRAHEEALARCERAKVDEEAWKAAERAIKAVREAEVGSSTAPLMADLNEFLKRAGRPELAYLELESERGKAIFELGWQLNGTRTPLTALSSGEAVLFAAGLSIAIARRAPGRRILLIEADPLDRENLNALLLALVPYGQEFDALLVATATGGIAAPDGWSEIHLEEAAHEAR